MPGWLRSLFARPTPLERAEAEAVARLDCQRVNAARALKERATLNGLLAAVGPEARALCEERLAKAIELREGTGRHAAS